MNTKGTKALIFSILPMIAVAGLVIFLSGKKRKKTVRREKAQIADEGYETAGDILFPRKKKSGKYRPTLN